MFLMVIKSDMNKYDFINQNNLGFSKTAIKRF